MSLLIKYNIFEIMKATNITDKQLIILELNTIMKNINIMKIKKKDETELTKISKLCENIYLNFNIDLINKIILNIKLEIKHNTQTLLTFINTELKNIKKKLKIENIDVLNNKINYSFKKQK